MGQTKFIFTFLSAKMNWLKMQKKVTKMQMLLSSCIFGEQFFRESDLYL